MGILLSLPGQEGSSALGCSWMSEKPPGGISSLDLGSDPDLHKEQDGGGKALSIPKPSWFPCSPPQR